MSLVKFMNRSEHHTHNGQQLHWGRAAHDGLPFRGATTPMYTNEEFESRVHRVGDSKVGTFDLSDVQQREAYQSILDGIVNGWFQCLYVERFHDSDDKKKVYAHIEWVEFFLEDGHPTPFSSGMMEMANGLNHNQATAGASAP